MLPKGPAAGVSHNALHGGRTDGEEEREEPEPVFP